jgi:hypothetical protein
MRPLPEELCEFIESGVSILVGSRDAELRPAGVRGFGARVGNDRTTLTVHLPDVNSGRVIANVRENGLIAVTFSRPIDHRAIQVKGTAIAVRGSNDEDRRTQEQYRAAFMEQVYAVGMPRAVMRRVVYWPSTAVEFVVEGLFIQTPGPSAGKSLIPPP